MPAMFVCTMRCDVGLGGVGAVGGEVKHPLRPDRRDGNLHLATIFEIDLMAMDLIADTLEPPGHIRLPQHQMDLMPVAQQPPGKIGADEATRSGDEGALHDLDEGAGSRRRRGTARCAARTSSRSRGDSSSAVARLASGVARRIVPQG